MCGKGTLKAVPHGGRGERSHAEPLKEGLNQAASTRKLKAEAVPGGWGGGMHGNARMGVRLGGGGGGGSPPGVHAYT